MESPAAASPGNPTDRIVDEQRFRRRHDSLPASVAATMACCSTSPPRKAFRNYAAVKSDTCGHRFDIPPHLEPSAVIIPAGRDCQHLNTCHYSLHTAASSRNCVIGISGARLRGFTEAIIAFVRYNAQGITPNGFLEVPAASVTWHKSRVTGRSPRPHARRTRKPETEEMVKHHFRSDASEMQAVLSCPSWLMTIHQDG